ncbi:MAG: hypothetical protein LBU14_01575 [Candidatus Peribacteria bacterium]|jgi:hypothetical protein|nr:hypothetical protein [Candidatus Peribacteria bacterium]
MTDIYDIKDIILLSPISVTNTIFVCIIFLMIYFLLFKKPHPNPFLKKEREQDQTIEESKIDYKKFISGFEKNYMSLDSKDFLKEISFIFRSFLEQDL